jgi:leader peptidase (prepilin peptidase)/N-methyltransferase
VSVLVFITGLIIGSFLNVCIYRIPKGESIVFPPSHCGRCGKSLKWFDLFPVISYVVLRGRCRYCGEKISLRYPLIEFITGVLFLAIYIKYGLSFELIKFATFVALLIVISMIDFDTMDVYTSTTIFGIVTGILFTIFGYYLNGNFMGYIIGALIGGGVISIIILLTKGMGWGDVEICGVCGLYLGIKLTIVTIFFSFIFGSIYGIALILTKKKGRKDQMPFGPFIAMAAVFAIFFGENIIRWYFSI